MPISDVIVGIGTWSVSGISIFLFSLVLWSFIRFHRVHLDFTLLVFLVVFHTTLLIFLMGIGGVLERKIVAGVNFFVFILCWGLYRTRIVDELKEIMAFCKDLSQFIRRNRLWTTGFFLVLFLIGLRMFVHVWFLPPYVWDTLTYHLPKVADWIQYERLVSIPTPISRSYWPANFELFQTWFVLFFHHDFLIEAAGLVFYLLAIVSVYSSGRSLEFSRRWSAFLAVLFALTPALMLNAVSCKNDVAVAAFYLFSLALMLDYRKHQDRAPTHLSLIVAAILLATGTKPYILFVLPGLMVVGFWCFRRFDRMPRMPFEKDKHNAALLFLLFFSLLLGGYWYVRNFVLFDNPFYPVSFHLFGHLVFGDGGGGGQQGSFQLSSLLLNFQDLVTKKIFDRNGPYDPDLSRMAGWGWFVFCCGLAASMYSFIKTSEFRWLMAGFIISLTGLFTMVTNDPWNMRFTLWFPAVFTFGYGFFVTRIKVSFFRWCFIAMAAGCTVLNFIGCLSTGYLELQEWKAAMAKPVWERAADAHGVRQVLEKIPKHEGLSYYSYANAGIYPFYNPDYSRKIHYLELRRDMDIVREMNKAGVRYLLLFEVGKEWNVLMEAIVHQGNIERIAEDLYGLKSPTRKQGS